MHLLVHFLKNSLSTSILIIVLCSYGVVQKAQAQRGRQDLADIRAVMAMQEAAWNRGDLPAFMEGYWRSDSLTFVSTRGLTFGWQQTLDGYKKGYPNTEAMGKLRFTILRLEKQSKRSAYMIGKWHLTRTIGDIGGHFMLIWKKIDGKWLIVADHTS
jgi:ketosteroid isomerase-like protein